MSTEEVSRSVETIEAEAEKVLDAAKTRASEILLKARDDAGKILSSKLSMDEVKTECENITQMAREEAGKKVQDAAEKASAIRTDADKKTEGIVKHLVDIIIGAKAKSK